MPNTQDQETLDLDYIMIRYLETPEEYERIALGIERGSLEARAVIERAEGWLWVVGTRTRLWEERNKVQRPGWQANGRCEMEW